MLFAQRIESSASLHTRPKRLRLAALRTCFMQATLESATNCSPGELVVGPEVSVVMPCLNEARTVGRCIDKAKQALQEMGIAGEVIIADNGSSDGSPELALL